MNATAPTDRHVGGREILVLCWGPLLLWEWVHQRFRQLPKQSLAIVIKPTVNRFGQCAGASSHDFFFGYHIVSVGDHFQLLMRRCVRMSADPVVNKFLKILRP